MATIVIIDGAVGVRQYKNKGSQKVYQGTRLYTKNDGAFEVEDSYAQRLINEGKAFDPTRRLVKQEQEEVPVQVETAKAKKSAKTGVTSEEVPGLEA